ncbi:MAG: hypothetical protein DMG49_22600 [Acidobacteria bacterium]|nr:MAG: hypothetical protein DMG49_22600 [Acidobacteriota bacterium]
MGLILDSSVVIAAERRGDTVEQFIERVINATGDQDAALSAIGLTELIHGLGSFCRPECGKARAVRGRVGFRDEDGMEVHALDTRQPPENCAESSKDRALPANPLRDDRCR